MCYNCGCGDPNDTMGNDNNITNQITLTNLSKKWGVTFDEVRQIVYDELVGKPPEDPTRAKDIANMYEVAAKAWGQTVEEGRASTLELMKRELNIQ